MSTRRFLIISILAALPILALAQDYTSAYNRHNRLPQFADPRSNGAVDSYPTMVRYEYGQDGPNPYYPHSGERWLGQTEPPRSIGSRSWSTRGNIPGRARLYGPLHRGGHRFSTPLYTR